MPDLTSERPPEGRGRRRTITQRSVSGLSALGLGAAVLITGAAHHAAAPASPIAAARGVTTLTETTSSAAGTMTVHVRYRPTRAGAELVAITYSGSSHASVRHPSLTFTLSKPVAGGTAAVSIAIKLSPSELGHFTGSVPLRPSVQRLPTVASTLMATLCDQCGTNAHYKHDTKTSDGHYKYRILIQEALFIIVRA
jgi:hypothetical protein